MARERLTAAYRLIESYIEAGEINGAALAVSIDGESIVDWYAGHASDELPSGPEVIWPLASISKLYTAAAIMSLVEEGRLGLSMRVVDLIPEFPWERTTLWHLLTHTSGLTYESPEVAQRLVTRTPLRALIDEAYEHPLVAQPGTRFVYSDYGIAVAARMAEETSGQPLSDLVRAGVIEAGALEETFMPPPEHLYGRIAHIRGVPADGTSGAMYNSDYGRQLTHPAFGTFASVRDLLRFGMFFWERSGTSLLSRASTRSMTRDQLRGGLPGWLVSHELHRPQPWGLGFMVRGSNHELGFGELASPSAFGHPGASGCLLLIDPELGLAMAFVSNRHAAAGFERFLFRNAAVTNTVLAGLT